MLVFSIKNVPIQFWTLPFCMPTIEAAKKMFAISTAGNLEFTMFPDDHFLYMVGEFDTSTGVLEPSNPEMVCSLRALMSEFPDVFKE